jgi:hypothetical protein
VNTDGDGFIETPGASQIPAPEWAAALPSVVTSVLEAWAPITSARADEDPPAPQVPQLQVTDPNAGYDIRHEFDGYYADTTPDYTAESFR